MSSLGSGMPTIHEADALRRLRCHMDGLQLEVNGGEAENGVPSRRRDGASGGCSGLRGSTFGSTFRCGR